ncbi:MAG TPA: two-component regulator propeller domain-containing protein, partial [Chitinophagaceae bacterium]|nr:two-component regulator propeller domain-containing protein [Chitinophagaceae bacterium]
MRKLRFYILFVVLLSQWVYGQEAKRYSFAHYTNTSGLASNEVTSVIQDDEGYIWIATTDGLQRFDGVRFITFRNRKNDPSSLPANFVSELMIDKDRNLWVTIGGLHTGIFDRKNFTFQEVPIKPSKESFIYADKFMFQDEDGNIYILLWHIELLKYDRTRNAFLPVDFLGLPEGWKVTGFCQLPGTKKYVIGTSKGIALYNAQSGLINYTGHNVENEQLVENAGKATGAESFLVDMKGRLWFDTWETGGSTLCCYDTKNNSFLLRNYDFQPMLSSYHELKGMMEQRNGDLWMKGLNVFARYIEKEKRLQLVYNGYESEQSISYNRVYSLFEDKEENIWVATDRDGLYRFNPRGQFFNNIRQVNRITGKLGNGGVMSFMPTLNGDILVGIWEDGFYRYDSNYNKKPVNLPLIEKHNPSVWSMFKSRDGHTIWMGAQPGIWRLDENTQEVQFFNPEALKNRTVRQVAEDPFGNLWIGTQSIGLFKWTKEKGKKRFDDGISFFDPVPSGMINQINIDNSGLVWVATAAGGAYVIDPSTDKLLMHFGTKEPSERKLVWDGVASALQFDDSTVIIAANSLALYNTRQKKITQ